MKFKGHPERKVSAGLTFCDADSQHWFQCWGIIALHLFLWSCKGHFVAVAVDCVVSKLFWDNHELEDNLLLTTRTIKKEIWPVHDYFYAKILWFYLNIRVSRVFGYLSVCLYWDEKKTSVKYKRLDVECTQLQSEASQDFKIACVESCKSASHICVSKPMDCSLPGSSVLGILHARILEWVAILFSRGSSLLRDQTQVSCIAVRFFTIWANREALCWVIFDHLEETPEKLSSKFVKRKMHQFYSESRRDGLSGENK